MTSQKAPHTEAIVEVPSPVLREPTLVLVVEWNSMLRQQLELFLRSCLTDDTRIVSVSAHNKAQLTQLLSLRPAVIVVGIGMPVTSGLRLIARMKSDLPNTAIIAYCWLDSDDYRQSVQKAGAEMFVCSDRLSTHLPRMVSTLLAEHRYADL